MSKVRGDSARRQMDRVDRLRRRMKQLLLKNVNPQEISALEWAIPILENKIVEEFGELPPSRYPMYKHEYADYVTKLKERDGAVCYLCNLPLGTDISIDHVVPISKGGKDDMENYKLTHAKCNLKKGSSDLSNYLQGKPAALNSNEGSK